MNRISLILLALMMVSIAAMFAPRIFAMNRGKILETVALWLAIFLGLAFVYKNFGPDSPHPLFHLPEAMAPAPQSPPKDDGEQNRG